MAEWKYAVGPPQVVEEVVARTPVPRTEFVRREWDKSAFLLCSHCREPIEHGEQCMEFIPGVSGFGAKSGRPSIVDTPFPDYEHAVLHIGCIYDYVFEIEESLAYQEDEPKYCAGCEAKLSGDDG